MYFPRIAISFAVEIFSFAGFLGLLKSYIGRPFGFRKCVLLIPISFAFLFILSTNASFVLQICFAIAIAASFPDTIIRPLISSISGTSSPSLSL